MNVFSTISGTISTDCSSKQPPNNHYPFGLRMPGRAFVSDPEGNRYQFTGHEFDGETNYGYHGARYYNRELGRHMSVDPKVKNHESPYAYAADNPVWFIDVNGEDTLIFDASGNFQFKPGGDDIVGIDVVVQNYNESDNVTVTQNDGRVLAEATFGQMFFYNNGEGYDMYMRKNFDASGIMDYLGTVNGESSNSQSEAQGIGMVILNRLRHTGNSLTVDGMDDIDGGTIVARDEKTQTYRDIQQLDLEEVSNLNLNSGYGLRVKGALNAIQNQRISDESNGAFFWENNTSYSQRNNYFNRQVRNGVFIETGSSGNSTFFKYNSNNTTYGRNVWP